MSYNKLNKLFIVSQCLMCGFIGYVVAVITQDVLGKLGSDITFYAIMTVAFGVTVWFHVESKKFVKKRARMQKETSDNSLEKLIKEAFEYE